MPHCLHFPSCRNGTACRYAHVHVSPQAKVCVPFVSLGWCENGIECKERHVWECPEFSETGKCGKRGCKLPHVLRRRPGEGDASAQISDGVNDTQEAASISASDVDNEEMTSDQEVISALLTSKSSTKPSGSVRSRKRSISTASEDEGSDADSVLESSSVDDESAGKKKKLRFDPLKNNEDFITLVLSDSDEDEGDEEESETPGDVESEGLDDFEEEDSSEEAAGDETVMPTSNEPFSLALSEEEDSSDSDSEE